MSDSLEMQPVSQPVCGEVRPPGSKSITNRALICAALAEGESLLRGALDSEDTQVMIAGLKSLGVKIRKTDRGETLAVSGCRGKPPANKADIFVGNSGTTVRFLTSLATLGKGTFRLDGIPRMRQRPIADLVDALEQLGATIRYEQTEGYPPVIVDAHGLAGGKASIPGNISSQFLSGLLMAAPAADTEVHIQVTGTLVSVPYVRMTLEVMRAFGLEAAANDDYSKITFRQNQDYVAAQYEIEPDASAASYFWAAAAITGGRVMVEGLGRGSLQGDVQFVECLEKMGCIATYEDKRITIEGRPLIGIDVDMNSISDTVQTLAVVALFAEGPTRIRNIEHIRFKETDRIEAVATELRKLGAEVTVKQSELIIVPRTIRAAEIDTYEDHRMAMSFALAGLVEPGIQIRNPGCTQKTYPHFFSDLRKISQGRKSP